MSYGSIYSSTWFGEPTDTWGNIYKDLAGGGASYLLDDYSGGIAAYSLRKLRNDYTGYAIQVTPSGQAGSYTDIGFNDDGELDTSSLPADNDLYISKWYNQADTSDKDMVQTSFSLMPIIKSGGTINTIDGKPYVKFNVDQIGIANSANQVAISPPHNITFVLVAKTDRSDGKFDYYARGNSGGNGYFNVRPDKIYWRVAGWTAIFSLATWPDGAPTNHHIHIATAGDNTSVFKYFANGTEPVTITTAVPATGQFEMKDMLQGFVGSHSSQGIIQEMIIFDEDHTSDAGDLNTAINDHYEIYS